MYVYGSAVEAAAFTVFMGLATGPRNIIQMRNTVYWQLTLHLAVRHLTFEEKDVRYLETSTVSFTQPCCFIFQTCGSLFTKAWRVLRLRLEERSPDMEVSCEYIESAVADGRKGGWSSYFNVGRDANKFSSSKRMVL